MHNNAVWMEGQLKKIEGIGKHQKDSKRKGALKQGIGRRTGLHEDINFLRMQVTNCK